MEVEYVVLTPLRREVKECPRKSRCVVGLNNPFCYGEVGREKVETSAGNTNRLSMIFESFFNFCLEPVFNHLKPVWTACKAILVGV